MTIDDIKAHIAARQAEFTAREQHINLLKDERDAFIAANRDVYDAERRMATEIKALQEVVVPIAIELQELRKLIGGTAASV